MHISGAQADLIGKHAVLSDADSGTFVCSKIGIFHGGAGSDGHMAPAVLDLDLAAQLTAIRYFDMQVIASHKDFKVVQPASIANRYKVVMAPDLDCESGSAEIFRSTPGFASRGNARGYPRGNDSISPLSHFSSGWR